LKAMKKQVRRLTLGKETLRHLAAPRRGTPAALALAAGGAAAAVVAPLSQEGTSCIQSCYFNTCYDTCQWEAGRGA
jgi:hypothetical protein